MYLLQSHIKNSPDWGIFFALMKKAFPQVFLYIIGRKIFIKGADYMFDGAIAFLAVLLLYLFSVHKKQLTRPHGFIFVAIYIAYVTWLICI